MSRNPAKHIPPGFVRTTPPVYARLLSQMLDKTKRGGVLSVNEVQQSQNYREYIEAGAPSGPVWKETEGDMDLPWRVVIQTVLGVPMLFNTWKLGEGSRYYYNPKAKWDFEYRSPQDVVGQWRKQRNPQVPDYPRAGAVVDGLTVGSQVPNLGSISSSFSEGEYRVLKGVREVPMADLGEGWESTFYNVKERQRSERLAEMIAHNQRIDPVIIVIDEDGPYILEGAHRMSALAILKRKAVPAVVVVELH